MAPQTPPRPGMSQNPEYLLGTTQSVRSHVCSYIAEVPQVDLAVFLNHYMPKRTVSCSPADIARALSERWRFPTRPYQSAADAPSRAPLDMKNSRWTQFLVDPKDQGRKEAAVYSSFEGIFDQVVACCLEFDPKLEQTTKYFNEGDRQAQSTKTSRSRRDGDIRLRWPSGTFGDGGMLYTHAVTIQLKKAEKDCMENSRQLCWELIHTLRSEPGRRFVLGMSVENKDVRLWHFNREIVVVSTAFDFQKNYMTFIDVFARFAFAPPSQLGYDPSFIKGAPLEGGGREHDQIIINGTKYELTRVLQNHRANAAIGRCSWIWEAKPLGTNKVVVIKDCWMEDDRKTEFEILDDIRRRIKAFDWKTKCIPPGAAWRRLGADDPGPVDPHYHDVIDRTAYFVDIHFGERVKVEGQVDNTRTVMARGHLLPSPPTSGAVLRITPRAESRQRASHMTGTSGNESQDDIGYAPVNGIFENGTNARAHHRLIMSRGKPLDHITDPALAFSVLRDASYGLFVMHQVGYLHRDPSAPNILLADSGLGVLSDLEYARDLLDEQPAHVGRTGTPNYVAIEVIQGAYLMGIDSDYDDDVNPIPDLPDGSLAPLPDHDPTPTPWRMCEVHDIESLFWIAIWIFFRHTLSRYARKTAGAASTAPSTQPYDVDVQRATYRAIFPGVWVHNLQERRNVLLEAPRFKSDVAKLPPEFQKMARYFDLLRHALVNHYKKSGERKIHGGLWHMLHTLCMYTARDMPKDELVPLSQVQLRAEKRRAVDDAVDPDDSGRGRAEGPMKLSRANS
ncbi:hypothetical protein EV715DRAFT_285913 [Schizophyllum commune]